MGKTIKIQDDLAKYLNERKATGQSYDGAIKEAIGDPILIEEAESHA